MYIVITYQFNINKIPFYFIKEMSYSCQRPTKIMSIKEANDGANSYFYNIN